MSSTTNKKQYSGDDLLEFHQAVVSTLRDADDIPIPLDPAPMIPHSNMNTHTMMMPQMNDELGRISDVVNTDQPLDPEDEMDPGMNDRLKVFLYMWWIYEKKNLSTL